MCGIAGTIRLGDRSLVERMTEVMAYRGPDDSGIYVDGEVCLGHRRLSILDLSAAGHQPMLSEDGQLVVTYNGEIYNYPQLRSQLESMGYRFRSNSDTEVLLHAYDAFGLDFVERLEGMFGFALWDRRNRQLVVGRDRTGMKPLFYLSLETGFAFASELKPLLLVPGIRREVDRRALRSAIRYASNIEETSMLQDVRKLPPGHVLVWKDGSTSVRAYWRHPEAAPEPWNEERLVRELRGRLTEVVHSHMLSDAPLGAALSGGLDSSAIVALMAQSAGSGVSTFTVGHGPDDPDLLKSRRVAEHCGTRHNEIMVTGGHVPDLLPRVVWHLEEPLGQMESVQMYLNYQEAARHAKVLLIGEGADECFAGYARYKLLARGLPMPHSLRKDLYDRVYMYADEAPRTLGARVLSRCLWGTVCANPVPDAHPRAPMPLTEQKGRAHLLERALVHDQATYLHHLSLKRADALGMAHSLELRVPFVDRRILELSARIPSSLLIRRGVEKYILRRAVEGLLPSDVVWRPKRPFQMRLSRDLVEALDLLCDRLLSPGDVRARGFFEPARVETLRRGRPGPHAAPVAHKVWSYRVWSMLLCELWARIFLDRPITPNPPASLSELL